MATQPTTDIDSFLETYKKYVTVQMCQSFEYHWGSLEPAAYYLLLMSELWIEILKNHGKRVFFPIYSREIICKNH